MRTRIAAELGTYAGRRTVVTTLFVDGDEALEDIAHFVGHARPTTTADYVKRLGRRPEAFAKRAAAVLDGQAEVRNVPADSASNAASYPAGSASRPLDTSEPKPS
jgi:hypothetical protein